MDFIINLDDMTKIIFNIIEKENYFPSYYYEVKVLTNISRFENSFSMNLWFAEDIIIDFFREKKQLHSMSDEFMLNINEKSINIGIKFNYFTKYSNITQIIIPICNEEQISSILNQLDQILFI